MRRGRRVSRGGRRTCVPDHSTIAEFRCRHEQALGEVFSGVLGLCARAGLASIGVVAIDGTKMSANASMNANRDFGQIAREILAEAAETDRREDELYGDAARRRAAGASAHARGPAQGVARGQGAPGARARPGAPRQRPTTRMARWRSSSIRSEFVTRPQGRRAWVREGRRALEGQREREARPIAQDRRRSAV